MSGSEHLVRMANDIGNFFESEGDRDAAIAGIAAHIRRFWEPRMRRKIYAHLDAGGEGLGDLPRAAIRQLAEKESAAN
ncbi:MAG: formate dehydrogenase subunit delta [Dokdonella sp.]|uniref:formate dehydrogenase subunit delta n=1 Tax=Dokdonella sp. TaxID=2291710 RepID=UPI00326604E1